MKTNILQYLHICISVYLRNTHLWFTSSGKYLIILCHLVLRCFTFGSFFKRTEVFCNIGTIHTDWVRLYVFNSFMAEDCLVWMDWFLYDNGLRHERVKQVLVTCWKIGVVENLMKFQKFPVVFQVKPSKTSNHGETVFF